MVGAGYGERFDELFAGTLSLTIIELMLLVAAERDLSVMSLTHPVGGVIIADGVPLSGGVFG